MKKIILPVVILLVVSGCREQNDSDPFVDNKLNKTWLGKIMNRSDSNYKKPYFRRDFVTASYYRNKRDSTLCQVMRDSSEKVRQVIITKNDIRTFYAQFYPDGQATAITSLDKDGKFDGPAVKYYPDGKVQSKGKYENGLYSGIWETYNEDGKLVLTEEYDNNGQLIKTIQH